MRHKEEISENLKTVAWKELTIPNITYVQRQLKQVPDKQMRNWQDVSISTGADLQLRHEYWATLNLRGNCLNLFMQTLNWGNPHLLPRMQNSLIVHAA